MHTHGQRERERPIYAFLRQDYNCSNVYNWMAIDFKNHDQSLISASLGSEDVCGCPVHWGLLCFSFEQLPWQFAKKPGDSIGADSPKELHEGWSWWPCVHSTVQKLLFIMKKEQHWMNEWCYSLWKCCQTGTACRSFSLPSIGQLIGRQSWLVVRDVDYGEKSLCRVATWKQKGSVMLIQGCSVSQSVRFTACKHFDLLLLVTQHN